MDRLRKLLNRSEEQRYEPISDGTVEGAGNEGNVVKQDAAISYIDYSIFMLLGVSMLWAWNMLLAAGPYFQSRFQDSQRISDNFQAAEISVSTVTTLVAMLVLTKLQANASYPKRIIASLCINIVAFALLAASTSFGSSAQVYFGFLIVMIFSTSLATGLCQNGIFSFVSGFGQPVYVQSMMSGQAIAGVLPCIIQIASVLSIRPSEDEPDLDGPPVASKAAMAYFFAATGIAIATLLAFLFLLARHRQPVTFHRSENAVASNINTERKAIPLLYLFRKLFWLTVAIFITFTVTMFFPVFTQRIVSVLPVEEQPRLLQPASFIPLAFLFWNSGDLIGRLLSGATSLSLTHRPKALFALSVIRSVFVGLYFVCNINGRGAIVQSDFFYLVIVQFLFGISNGYVGSSCMIGASACVEPDEREAAGSFMGLCLVAGLTVGSLASFSVANA